jgi:hypothetical protein
MYRFQRIWKVLIFQIAILLGKIFSTDSSIYLKCASIYKTVDSKIVKPVISKYTERLSGQELLKSKICTESDFHKEWFQHWVDKTKCDPVTIHRKTWEYATITQALYERKMLKPGLKGLGFGVGKEPLPSLFAHLGCEVLATDIGPETEQGRSWQACGGNLSNLNELHLDYICDKDTFLKNVSYRVVDMNQIPKDLYNKFDFTWSNCSFEHLGSIKNGQEFIIEQMKCLKKGGWAVHTTEFNISSNHDTTELSGIVLFRRRDIEALINRLHKSGYHVEELDTSMGNTKADYFVDVEPYTHNPHLRLKVYEYVSTSIILIIQKSRH